MKNRVIVDTDVSYIIVKGKDNQEEFVTVDTADLRLISQVPGRWRIHRTSQYGSAYLTTHIGRRTIYLHRWIMQPTNTDADKVVDHISGDGFDCRRENLQIITHAENLRKMKIGETAKGRTGFRKVYQVGNKWVVQVAGEHFGTFGDVQLAASTAATIRQILNSVRLSRN